MHPDVRHVFKDIWDAPYDSYLLTMKSFSTYGRKSTPAGLRRRLL